MQLAHTRVMQLSYLQLHRRSLAYWTKTMKKGQRGANLHPLNVGTPRGPSGGHESVALACGSPR